MILIHAAEGSSLIVLDVWEACMVRVMPQILAQMPGLLLWEWWKESWWQASQLPTSHGN